MVQLDVRDIAPGVRLHVSPEAKWKTTTLLVRISAPLDEDPTRTSLVPTVLERGTGRWPTARDLAKRLEELYDAAFENDMLRIGDIQVIEYRMEVANRAYVPAGGEDPFAAALDLLAEILWRPALDPAGLLRADAVDLEREQLRRHIQGLRDDRIDYALVRTRQLLGRGEPSSRYEFGDVAELGKIGPRDLTERWRALVDRYPIDILVAGDQEPAEVERLVRAAFPLDGRGRASTEAPSLPRPSRAPRKTPPERVLERADIVQAHICLGYRTGVGYLDADYPALAVLNAVLGADAQSRLFLRVREDEGLAYEASTSLDRQKGTITAHCGIDPKNAARVEALVEEEVARLRSEDVDEEELEEARKLVAESIKEAEDDPHLRLSFSYARNVVGSACTLSGLIERVGSVRPEDLRAAAGRLVLDSVFELAPGA